MYFKIIYWDREEPATPIDESEYEKAVRAQVKKSVMLSNKHGSISGADIKKITPDYDKEGKVYNPRGEDVIPPTVIAKYEAFMEEANEAIERQFAGLPPSQTLHAGRRATDPILPAGNTVHPGYNGPKQIGELIDPRLPDAN